MPPTDRVEIVRLTHEIYIVTAYDLFGRTMRVRRFEFGRKRREWAIEQARQWAEQFGLWHDEQVYS